MRFGSAVLSSVLVAASTIRNIEAFNVQPPPSSSSSSSSPRSIITTRTTLDHASEKSLILPSSSLSPSLLLNHDKPHLQQLRMVAGGAERAQNDEYYEGSFVRSFVTMCFFSYTNRSTFFIHDSLLFWFMLVMHTLTPFLSLCLCLQVSGLDPHPICLLYCYTIASYISACHSSPRWRN